MQHEPPPHPTPQIVSAAYDSANRTLTITFSVPMYADPQIDPAAWAVRTGFNYRTGSTVNWLSATVLELFTQGAAGAATPVEGIYSGEALVPHVESIFGIALPDQTFAVTIV